MRPHEQCKLIGLNSLVEVSKISGVSIQTLNNWSKNKPSLFEVVLLGSKTKKEKVG